MMERGFAEQMPRRGLDVFDCSREMVTVGVYELLTTQSYDECGCILCGERRIADFRREPTYTVAQNG